MTDIKESPKLPIGEKLRTIRKAQKLTQTEFGKKIGLQQSYVADLERGRNKPSYDTLIKIMQTFHVNPYWLLSDEEKHKDTPVVVADVKGEYKSETKYNALPIVNTVPAGYPDYPLDDEIRYHFYIPNVPKNAFGLIVDGASMEPELYTGDIVIVNPNIMELKKGEIGVFRYQGGATIKICMPLPDNKGFLLQARNPRSESYIVTDETCTIIGKVIFKIVKCK